MSKFEFIISFYNLILIIKIINKINNKNYELHIKFNRNFFYNYNLLIYLLNLKTKFLYLYIFKYLYKKIYKMEKHIRNCPVCNKEILYKTKKSIYWAKHTNSPCRSCAILKLERKGKIKKDIPSVGTIFDYWTVTDNILKEIRKGHWAVKCKCKCGTEKYVRITALVSGKSKGCVCRTKDINKLKVNAYGDLSDTFWGRIIKSAKIRNIEFNITKEFAWKLFLKQNKKCALSNLDLIMEKSMNRKKGCANITASLDRIDSSKGYIENNIQWVHKDVNKMKQELNEDYFKELCKKITKKWT